MFDVPTYCNFIRERKIVEPKLQLDPSNPDDAWFLQEHNPDRQVIFIQPKNPEVEESKDEKVQVPIAKIEKQTEAAPNKHSKKSLKLPTARAKT